MISSYQAAAEYMEKARSKAKGRPMRGTGWRLFQDGDEYPVYLNGGQVGRFLPDNTFMFTVDGDRAHSMAQTLGSTMHRNLPFKWRRFGYKKYRVDHTTNIDGHYYQHFAKPTNAPQIYDGLKFDLTTGKCLNYQPDYKPTINPDRRGEWLAASREWKRKLKAAARVGVFDKLVAEERQNPTPWQERPVWRNPEMLDILYKAFKDGDCSVELLRMFVASESRSWVATTSGHMYDSVTRIVSSQSRELRKRFGVFEGE